VTAQTMRAQIDSLGLASLTEDERKHSAGKLRNGEAAAMTTILDTVDLFPAVFAALADKDGGFDANLVETAPSRALIARAQVLAPFAAVVETILSRVSDDMLSSAATAKEVTGPAYAIGKANATSNPKVKRALSTAIDFYAKSVRVKGAKAAKAAKSAKTAATASS
jgi:hypothetical protein